MADAQPKEFVSRVALPTLDANMIDGRLKDFDVVASDGSDQK